MKAAWERALQAVEAWQAACLRYLLTSAIPVWVQTTLRDVGFFQILSDTAFMSAASALALYRPTLMVEFLWDLFWKSSKVQYGLSPAEFALTLDFSAAESTTTAERVRPILLFVHGGAWGSGRPWQYLLVAKRLAHLLDACSLAVVGYPVYPQASILQQRDSILDAVDFFRTKYHEEHQLDRSLHPVVLCGHSSGANISLLAAMQGASEHDVQVFVGLAGVYDIHHHYQFESSRGVQMLSPMGAAAGGVEGFDACSPRVLLHRQLHPYAYPTCSTETERLIEREITLPQKLIFLHGTVDSTVPVSSSADMAALVESFGAQVTLCCPKIEHLTPLLDLVDLLPPTQRPPSSAPQDDTVAMLHHAWARYLSLVHSAK